MGATMLVGYLAMALIETDFITISFPPRPPRPDEACPAVTVHNAAGEARLVHKWVGDPHPGFDTVDQRLRGLAECARLCESLYQGPFDPTFTPAEAAPISGAISGDGGQAQLSVHVDVRPAESLSAAA